MNSQMAMNKKMALIIAIVLQFCILVGMLVRSALPLWTGTEIKVRTQPIDPRSLFRGNYARLAYDFSRLNFQDSIEEFPLRRQGEVIYVPLEKGEDGIYKPLSPTVSKPKEGVFLRGRAESRSWRKQVRVKYGIEAFFAPKEKALALERQLRQGAIAVLMVDGSGSARIKEILPTRAP